MKTINNDLIRSFNPCYDPSEMDIPNNETLPVLEWVEKYRGIVPAKDIVWLLCRNEFLSDKDLRLFAVWCARDALKLVEHPDARSVEACNVAERFANGDATLDEISAAARGAWAASTAASTASAESSASTAASTASAESSARAAAWAASAAAWDACYALDACYASYAAREAQLNQLLTYFK